MRVTPPNQSPEPMPFGAGRSAVAVRVDGQRWRNFLLWAGIKQPAKTLEPTRLRLGFEGWPPAGPNFFCWENNQLAYTLPRAGVDFRDWGEVVRPTRMQWRIFWRVCDEVGVWNWRPVLGNMHICDGLQWSLELEFGHRRVVSRGQVSGSPAGTGNKLMKLHQTLQAMAGWRNSNKVG
jgi:hypothetical protein